ncbi:acetyl-CoA carboxylase biotin carboxyl carrier protein [Lentibacillus sp. Marseille-P4043]|uniref:acetyl-CoA carboxylase biotin carboxyl carrier protein n=1 Tax=Lentibacillus sp. Marseille-P4043 TaxID=2040293 RepID=UPI000D0B6580|nr:acetyl-CoA carboxylase biotin carboxyl carrier protein [Lentibacillus sp. Marseille-P4043]
MLKVQEIREIIKLIDQSSIDEFSYEADGATVSLKKSSGNVSVQPVEQVVNTVEKPVEVKKQEVKQVEAEPEKETPVKEAEETPTQTTVDYDYEVESPMVGTLYMSPSPEADPYVRKGSPVEKDTVVCIVEAMKLFNEIEAETNGEIVEILVEDGQLVEYGQPLFRVKTK